MNRPTLHLSLTMSISRRARPVADTRTTDRFLARLQTVTWALFRPQMISMQRGAQNAHLNYQGARLVKLKVNCAGGSLMTLENNDSHQLCSDYSDRSPSSDGTL